MSRTRHTYVNRWDIEVDYGYGYEVVCSEDNKLDAVHTLADYQNNVDCYGLGYSRMVRRRERRMQ